MRACLHACMRACVHACMRACVRACVRACICLCEISLQKHEISFDLTIVERN